MDDVQKRDLINDLMVMIRTPSSIAQLRQLPSNSVTRIQFEPFLTDPTYGSLDASSKLLLGTQCAAGGYADVYFGYLLTSNLDASPVRKIQNSRKQFCKYLKKNHMVFKKVAVKRSRISPSSRKDEKSFSQELRLWAKLKHPNVLPLLGFKLIDSLPCFISEWMEHGTVMEFMAKKPGLSVTYMALQIARGLAYLHEKDVVHGDLKPDNILISHDGRPLLSDFGVSRIAVESATVTATTPLRGNPRYMAPELLSRQKTASNHEFSTHTKQSDGWAFSMVIYEILTGHVPYHTTVDSQVVNGIISNEYPIPPLSRKHEDFEEMWYLCWKFWRSEPRLRPTCSQIVTILETPLPPDPLDLAKVPTEFKKERRDWLLVCNPEVPKTMDVELIHTLTHDSPVFCVGFSSDGKYVATGCYRTAQIYDARTGEEIWVLNVHGAGAQGYTPVLSVCFSPDGKYLATSGDAGPVRIWDIAGKCTHRVLEGHASKTNSLSFSRDGRFIVFDSKGSTACIWIMESDNVIVLSAPARHGFNASVVSVAISPDMTLVAGGYDDGVVRIWDVTSGHIVEVLEGHSDFVWSVAYTPDGKGLVSGSWDRAVKHWDLTAFLCHPDRDTPLSASPRADGSNDAPPSSTPQNRPLNTDFSSAIPADAASKYGYGKRGSVCTFDLVAHKNYVRSVALSPDGQWVVSGSDDRDVRIWNSSTAEPLMLLRGHKHEVSCVDWSSTGDALASGSFDRTVRLWRLNKV